MSSANYRAASAEKGKQAETFSLLIPAASLRATQLSSAAENLQSIGGNSIQGEHLLDGKATDEKHMTSITSFKSKRQGSIKISEQSASSTDHACTGKVNEGGQAHHLLPLRAHIVEARHLPAKPSIAFLNWLLQTL